MLKVFNSKNSNVYIHFLKLDAVDLYPLKNAIKFKERVVQMVW
jgi:hypothetical protein